MINQPQQEQNNSIGLDDVFLPLLIAFVAFASFGLGRLSLYDTSPIHNTQPRNQQSTIYPYKAATEPVSPIDGVSKELAPALTSEQGGTVIASVNGTRYHFPWCSGGKRIADENKLTFTTTKEAREAGYTPALNCKGLD